MGYFLMLIAVSIAGVAGYFSVYGLAHIFAATFWSVVIMGGILEVGKLVATSFLYRYWDHIQFSLKAYLFVAIIGLMALTSAGIFGYLSNAYQQDIVGVKDVAARIELLDTEMSALVAREEQINSDIGRIGSNYVSARQNMIKQYAPEKKELTTRIAAIRTEQLELSSKQLEVEAHTGPIIYIAKSLDKTVDDAVVWMICLIIFVFDPLAVALTIAANIALTTKLTKTTTEPIPIVASAPEPEPEPVGAPPVVSQKIEHPDIPQDIGDAWIGAGTDDLVPVPDPIDDVVKNLTAELRQSQEMVDSLETDNHRLEDALFALASAFAKKDAPIHQLKEAIKALDKPLTIQQRAELHERNQVATKNQ